MDKFLSWWDGVELWLSGLPFVLQALAVMPVVLTLAYFTAVLLDSMPAKAASSTCTSRTSTSSAARLTTCNGAPAAAT